MISSDYIWTAIGAFFGYLLGLNKKVSDIPKDLEKCNVERSQQDIDLAYYKKLTKKLVDENAELRKKLNEKNL
jgi:hypothetical protein